MLIANLDAQLEAKQTELTSVEDDILKIGKLIDSLKAQEKTLLSKRSDIIWQIEDIKTEMEDNK